MKEILTMALGGRVVEVPIMEDKGVENGSCNRTMCQKPGAVFYNKSTKAYYCRQCAEMIQASCFHFGDPLCFDEESLGVTKENFWRFRP